MNTRRMKISALICMVAMVIAGVFGSPIAAKAGDYAPSVPTAKIYGYIQPYEINPGETIDVKLPIRVSEHTISNPVVSIGLDDTPFEVVGDYTYTRDDVGKNTKLTSLNYAKTTYMNFKLRCKEGARKGTYDKITISFTCTDSMNNYITVDLEQPSKFIVKVVTEKQLPTLTVLEADMPETVKPNDNFLIQLRLRNMGELDAENVQISLTGVTEAGFVPDTFYGTAKPGPVPINGQ